MHQFVIPSTVKKDSHFPIFLSLNLDILTEETRNLKVVIWISLTAIDIEHLFFSIFFKNSLFSSIAHF